MRVMRAIGTSFWRFMVIFSFIVNIILVIVLLLLGLFIFDIKNNIAQPLVNGLHSSFVGLDQATIDWTIPVRDNIPIVLNIPLKTNTTVTLTEAVPLTVSATILRQGVDILGGPVQVNLSLPAGLQLPVSLDLNVPVNETVPVALDVRAVIPLRETQLHDVAENLRLLFEPLARGLSNLPNNFNEAGQLAGDVLAGNAPNLLRDNEYTAQPWPGFSRTAGLNYALINQPVPPANRPLETGIVPLGGIPALDEQLRPELYENGNTPADINTQQAQMLTAQNIAPRYFAGGMGDYYIEVQQQSVVSQQGTETSVGGATNGGAPGSDMGIIPTPSAPTPGG